MNIDITKPIRTKSDHYPVHFVGFSLDKNYPLIVDVNTSQVEGVEQWTIELYTLDGKYHTCDNEGDDFYLDLENYVETTTVYINIFYNINDKSFLSSGAFKTLEDAEKHAVGYTENSNLKIVRTVEISGLTPEG